MKTKSVIYLIFILLTFSLLLIPKDDISYAISESIIFCGNTVIPQLFLYICLSSLILELGIVESILTAFPKYGAEISAYTIGLLSGFPCGAIIAGNLRKKGLITERRCEYIISFSNNCSISFIFGYVSIFVGKSGAVSIFLSQMFLSLAFSFLFRFALNEEDICPIYFNERQKVSFSSVVTGVKNGAKTIINICGFILFFSALSMGILQDSPLWLKGSLELTSGISMLKKLPFESRLFFSSFFIGFSGLCVHFQVASASNCKMGKYFISKCVSALLLPAIVFLVHKAVSSF